MSSMDKIKPDTNALPLWKNKYKGPYVISWKVDGISGLYSTEHKQPMLFKGGGNKLGTSINDFIPLMTQLPQPILNIPFVVRGEFLIRKDTFNTKYSTKFANPRNFIGGCMNAIPSYMTIEQKQILANDIDFVAYQVINPPNLTPSQQFQWLILHNFKTVWHNIITHSTQLTNEYLSNTLEHWRQQSPYEIDGIIVADDHIYPSICKNPEYAFAFKMQLTDQMAETIVTNVEWNASKDGYLKPRVQIEPVHIGGVIITHATGHNAAFIRDNLIGIGAIITIIRSGDVIPYIKNVITPAPIAQLPDPTTTPPYHWTTTNIDIVLDDPSIDSNVLAKQIHIFMTNMNIEHIGIGIIKRLIEFKYNTIPKILHMSQNDFLQIPGFQKILSEKIYNNIHTQLKETTLQRLAIASNLFGRGISEKKIEAILIAFPNIIQNAYHNIQSIPIPDTLTTIPGIAIKTATTFIENIPKFIQFIKECGLTDKINYSNSSNSSTITEEYQQQPQQPHQPQYLNNQTFILTGFRDKALETKIISLGGKIGTTVSKKNTTAVIIHDNANINDNTTKIIDAKQYQIPIITVSNFLKKYIK